MNSNWSYSPETKIWVVTSVTLTFDLWPWPFAWTLPWSNVITPENFMMIRWWEHSQKGVTDGQTDRRTDRRTDGQTDRRIENTIHRAAWSQLKTSHTFINSAGKFMFVSSNYSYVGWVQLHIPDCSSVSNSGQLDSCNHEVAIYLPGNKCNKIFEGMMSLCINDCGHI